MPSSFNSIVIQTSCSETEMLSVSAICHITFLLAFFDCLVHQSNVFASMSVASIAKDLLDQQSLSPKIVFAILIGRAIQSTPSLERTSSQTSVDLVFSLQNFSSKHEFASRSLLRLPLCWVLERSQSLGNTCSIAGTRVRERVEVLKA